jgi:hypothetical protein
MQRAEKNIDGILGDLNLKLHRIRQESIDEELFDVIAGYEALTGDQRGHAEAVCIRIVNRSSAIR